MLALVLKGHAPEDFEPMHLPHILSTHSVQTKGVLHGSSVSAEPAFGTALQTYLASFQQDEDTCGVQHHTAVVQTDLDTIAAPAPDTACIGEFIRSRPAVLGSAHGNIFVKCNPHRVAQARAVTFVRNREEQLTEVWIEQVH